MLLRRFLLISLLAAPAISEAHDPGLSSATWWLEERRLKVELTFAPADIAAVVPLDIDGDGELTEADALERHPALEPLIRDAYQVHFDGKPVAASHVAVKWARAPGNENIRMELSFPIEADISRLSLHCLLLYDLPSGHRHYLSLLDVDGNLLGEALLDMSHSVYEQTLTTKAGHHLFQRFFALGVEHIVTGYDHLLFLFGLLIVGSSFAAAAKIITSFTIAHSITLVLATLDVVQVPARIVEPAIALSITYVGLENLFSRNLEHRWLLTFIFGLIHGLGFASALRELGIGPTPDGVALPLLAFNVGVEAGQIAIAAVALPVIWRLVQPSRLARYCPAASLIVVVMGGYWLLDRTLLE